GVWLCEYPGLPFQRSPVCACSLVSSSLLSGATMSQQSSLSQSAHSVRQVLTAYTKICIAFGNRLAFTPRFNQFRKPHHSVSEREPLIAIQRLCIRLNVDFRKPKAPVVDRAKQCVE